MAVAGRLREATRSTDLVARLGGAEFLVLLADLPDGRPSADEVLRVVSDRIAETVARPIELRDRQDVTTISIGAAMNPAQAGDAEELMRLADAKMYGQKRRGSMMLS